MQVVLSFPFTGRLIDSFVDYLEQVEADAEAGVTTNPFALYGDPDFLVPFAAIAVIGLVVTAAYEIVLIRTRGATLGQSAVGIRVRPLAAEGLPSWGQAVKRWVTERVAAALVGLYLYLDLLWPLWDTRRQALHDKWPGTVVVRTR